MESERNMGAVQQSVSALCLFVAKALESFEVGVFGVLASSEEDGLPDLGTYGGNLNLSGKVGRKHIPCVQLLLNENT